MLENLVITSNGQLGIDLAKLGPMKMDKILKDSAKTDDSESVEPDLPIETLDEYQQTDLSDNVVRGKGKTKEEEERIAQFLKNKRDRMKGFNHPIRNEDSDVHPGDLLITSYSSTTPEEARMMRRQLRLEHKLPEMNAANPVLPSYAFHFSGQKYDLTSLSQKKTKTFVVEGISPFDSAIVQIVTRIQ
jgi:hypothetical protein